MQIGAGFNNGHFWAKKVGCKTVMELLDDKTSVFELTSFAHLDGYCCVAQLPLPAELGSDSNSPLRSTIRLFEDGRLIGPPYSPHAEIIESGVGRYSHWSNALYFSSSDGTDPQSNGRRYTVLVQERVGVKAWHSITSRFEQLPDNPSSAAVYSAVEQTLHALYPRALLGEDDKLFWGEQNLLETYSKLCGTNRRSFERKFAVINLLKLTHEIKGDFAECGAYEGATAYMVADALRSAGVERRLHLFDSFEGLSVPGDKDGSFWTAGGLSADEQKARQNLSGFPNVDFYRGWIPERFDEIADRTFSFVHIDVDLYQPTMDSIEFFYPRLEKGGLIVCDDYGFTTCPGARDAMDEFFQNKRELIIHLPTGQGFIIKQ